MASRRLSQQAIDTLQYFDKYHYPLTPQELSFWSGCILTALRRDYYFLPGRSSLVRLRQRRENISQKKWLIAKATGERLQKIPSIAAVYVTGSLAMNNADLQDDIDLMIITYPNWLWLTRLVVNLYLYPSKRFPGQAQAPDKICPNLWLDTHNLLINHQSLYTAHEILQSKVLWDRDHVHYRFLKQNSWVEKYLPHAYSETFKSLKLSKVSKLRSGYLLLWPLNFVAFVVQYLYMLPKKTSERVGLGYAFFHPTNRT